VLLDECVDARLASPLSGFAVQTVSARGWAGITNGRLLALAQDEFDVLLTVDRNLSFQQHLPKYSIAVVLLSARTNRLADLVELVPQLIEVVRVAPKGTVTRVGA
jgi:hypothetical protein